MKKEQDSLKYFNWTSLFIIISISTIYIYTLFINCLNVPWADDFDLLKHFINLFDVKTFSEKIALFYKQHNEHRVLFTKSIFLLSHLIFGSINFKFAGIIGNAGLVLVAILLSLSIKHSDKKKYYILILPLFFIIIQYYTWEFIIWPISSTQNIYVFVFVFLSLYLLNISDKSSYTLILSIFFAIAATFSSGSGFIVFASGYIVLVLGKHQIYKYIPWSVAFLLSMCLYFFKYQRLHGFDIMKDTLSNRFPDLINYYFTFLGSIWGQIINGNYSFRFGLIISVVIGVFSLISILKKKNEVLVAYFCYILIATFIIGLSRAEHGVVQATGNRYIIYSILLLGILYCFILDFLPRYKMLFSILIGMLSAYYCISSYQKNIDNILHMNYINKMGIIAYNEKVPELFLPKSYNGASETLPILDSSKAKSVYITPNIHFNDEKSSKVPDIQIPEIKTDQIKFGLDIIPVNNTIISINSWAFVMGRDSKKSDVFIVLTSNTKNIVYDTKSFFSGGVANYFGSILYQKAGFSFILDRNELEKGIYKISILITNKKSKYLIDTDKQVQI